MFIYTQLYQCTPSSTKLSEAAEELAKAQPGASGRDAALGFGCAAALSSCELRYGAWKAQQVTGELQQVECHLAKACHVDPTVFDGF